MYSWTLQTRKPDDTPYMLGITDDLGRAQSAAEPHLESGKAFLCHIAEVRYAMDIADLTSCYVCTGLHWVGRLADGGRVAWSEHPGGTGVPGDWDTPGWTHATKDLH
jgi:hypothetical protein